MRNQTKTMLGRLKRLEIRSGPDTGIDWSPMTEDDADPFWQAMVRDAGPPPDTIELRLLELELEAKVKQLERRLGGTRDEQAEEGQAADAGTAARQGGGADGDGRPARKGAGRARGEGAGRGGSEAGPGTAADPSDDDTA